jgi:undecaprenyl-diphosphatase
LGARPEISRVTIMLRKIVSLDVAVFHFINDGLSSKWLDVLMPLVTQLGSFYFLLLFFIALILTKRTKHMAVIIVIFIVNAVAFELLKYGVGRHRPFVNNEVILRAQHLFTDSMETVYGKTRSFPSGHTAIAFMLATFLSYRRKKYRVLFYSLACAVGVSRIYLGVHYPIDIVAGLILGVVVAKLCLSSNYLNGWIPLKTKVEDKKRITRIIP